MLGHSWDHPNLNNIPAPVLAFEVTDTAARFDALGAPYSVQGHPAAVPERQRGDHRGARGDGLHGHAEPDLGDRLGPGALGGADPRRRSLNALRPGVAILLHDGPVDSPAGQATVDAVPLIIDAARARGYCFGTVDRDRAGRRGPATCPRRSRSPRSRAPVPVRPARLPGRAAGAVGRWCRSRCGSRRPTARRVRARRDRRRSRSRSRTRRRRATDGSTTTVTHPLPAGLTLDRRVRRRLDVHRDDDVHLHATDVLAPGASVPADHAQRPRRRRPRPR